MKNYIAEFIGTAILILLGNGVVANVVLNRTKGHGGGWIVIAAGWACAVFAAVFCVGEISGAHLNPAVTLGLTIAGAFNSEETPGYVAAQMLGAFCGALLVYLCYKDHFDATDDPDAKLACFCTAPAVRSPFRNFICETIATFILVFAVLQTVKARFYIPDNDGNLNEIPVGLGSIGGVGVALIVFAIGLSLGGTTGYAINPARDLSPRIAHELLPMRKKRNSDWWYAPIPVLGPLLGAALAALVTNALAAKF